MGHETAEPLRVLKNRPKHRTKIFILYGEKFWVPLGVTDPPQFEEGGLDPTPQAGFDLLVQNRRWVNTPGAARHRQAKQQSGKRCLAMVRWTRNRDNSGQGAFRSICWRLTFQKYYPPPPTETCQLTVWPVSRALSTSWTDRLAWNSLRKIWGKKLTLN